MSRPLMDSIGHANLHPIGRVVYRMVMPAVVPYWTVKMLDALPDDGQRYEIIDGELFVTPSPAPDHQDVVLRDDYSRNRVQPDVFVIRRVCDERPVYPYALGGLMLAVEVVSSGNALYDYQTKRSLYLRDGVEEYWVINPDARNVSIWKSRDEPGEVVSEELRWMPVGAESPLVIQLPEFFEEAFR